MSDPTYPAARGIAAALEEHFAHCVQAGRGPGGGEVEPPATPPDAGVVERIIDAAFWASLRREEGRSPRISLAFLAPEQSRGPLLFRYPLPLDPATLTKLAPAVERPGIHLGVWGQDGALRVWGATRRIPRHCFVLEVIEPGVLVVKRRRERETAKYANAALIEADQVKMVEGRPGETPADASPFDALFGVDTAREAGDPLNPMVQLGASMRAHGRGGCVLVVPEGTTAWRDSIARPVTYDVVPPYPELAVLTRAAAAEKRRPEWLARFRNAVDSIGGLTAVDGATVISSGYQVLAFGAKIVRRMGAEPIERLSLHETVVGATPFFVDPSRIGGTRHLSAAQFVHDQRDAVAAVASQDGRFTLFSWSPEDGCVRALRVEALLV